MHISINISTVYDSNTASQPNSKWYHDPARLPSRLCHAAVCALSEATVQFNGQDLCQTRGQTEST